MLVLVTGSAGHIGRWQVEALREAGYEIRTFDRAAQPKNAGWEHLPGDLRDIDTVRRAVQGVDAVVHLGAIASDHRGSGSDILSVNVQGTWNVLLACAEAEVKRVVYYSSVNALGNFGGHRPSTYLPIDDIYPRHPQTPYQLSKHLAEETCRVFSDTHDIVTIALRPMYVAQPDHYDRWFRFGSERRLEWGKGDYWAYVDVRDVCDAAVRALRVEGVKHDAFLLAANETTVNVPTLDLIERYYADTPWTVDRDAYFADNPYRSLIDCSHARRVLGWEPVHSWRVILEEPAKEGAAV